LIRSMIYWLTETVGRAEHPRLPVTKPTVNDADDLAWKRVRLDVEPVTWRR
jgi:hypothetical protein